MDRAKLRIAIQANGGIPIPCSDGRIYKFTRDQDIRWRAQYADDDGICRLDVTLEVARLVGYIKRTEKYPERKAIYGVIAGWLKRAEKRRPWKGKR